MREELTSPYGYFEDFAVGQRYRHARGATIGEVENSVISKLVMNTGQCHWNEHWSRVAPGRVVFGLVTGSVVFGLASQDVAEHAIAELGCTHLRFNAPVRHGETLFALTEVLDVSPSERADAGVVRFKHWGITHSDRVVFEGERTVLMKRRSAWVGGETPQNDGISARNPDDVIDPTEGD
jgi:itaconyl-CoA hydratase